MQRQITKAVADRAIARTFTSLNASMIDRLEHAIPKDGISKPDLMRLVDQHVNDPEIQKLKAKLIHELATIEREKEAERRANEYPEKEDIKYELRALYRRAGYEDALSEESLWACYSLLDKLWGNNKFSRSLKGVPASKVAEKIRYLILAFEGEIMEEIRQRSFGTPEGIRKLSEYLSKSDNPWIALQKINQLDYSHDIMPVVQAARSTKDFKTRMNAMLDGVTL